MELNEQGGAEPENSAEMARAKKTDLITLPETIVGTNCSNCEYVGRVKKSQGIKVGWCVHPRVDQPVSERNCCALWSAYGVIRPWQK